MIKTKSIVFWYFSISVILYSNFAIFYKNAKIWKLIFSLILLYLQKYLSYKDVQYLILKLLTNCFDL